VVLKYALHAHSQLSSLGQTYFIAPPMQGIQQVGMEDMYWATSGWLRGGALGREVAEGGSGRGLVLIRCLREVWWLWPV
jgi:hypothetical protein